MRPATGCVRKGSPSTPTVSPAPSEGADGWRTVRRHIESWCLARAIDADGIVGGGRRTNAVKATQEAVWRMCDRLCEEGKPVSAGAVIRALGGGGHETVRRHIDTWALWRNIPHGSGIVQETVRAAKRTPAELRRAVFEACDRLAREGARVTVPAVKAATGGSSVGVGAAVRAWRETQDNGMGRVLVLVAELRRELRDVRREVQGLRAETAKFQAVLSRELLIDDEVA